MCLSPTCGAQVLRQGLAAAREELSPILAPLLPLLQAVHNAHRFPCCLGAVAAAVETCGQLDSCQACLVAAVSSFVDAVLRQLQVRWRVGDVVRFREKRGEKGGRPEGVSKACIKNPCTGHLVQGLLMQDN